MIRNLAFLPFGPRTHAELPPYDTGSGANTVISMRSYNLRGQVSALEVTSPLGDVLDQSFTYGYIGGAPGPVDGGPNLDQLVDSRDSSQSRFYFYDDLDRLWKSTNLSGTPLFTYTYDANGNRTQQVAPAGTTNYSYASNTDRIAVASGAAAKHYAHDAFGNRIWAGASAYAGQSSHLYDQGNRLVEVRDPATQAVLGQYTYDAAGRRVRKIAGGVTTLYFYDAAGHLVESQNLSTSPAMRRSYVFVEDEPMGIVDQPPSGSPVFSWIHTDRLGTPLAVTSTPSGVQAKAIWRATYEPFGFATADENPDGDSQSFSLDLRFPGQVFDAESGAHYNYLRDYDASIGQYQTADPIGLRGGQNVYGYALANPVMLIDAIGLSGGPYHPPAGVSFRCTPADSCSTLKGKLWIVNRMIQSHQGWDQNNASPRGGGRHATEIAELWRAHARCQALYDQKCKAPQCEPAPRPGDAPAPDVPQPPPWLPFILIPFILSPILG